MFVISARTYSYDDERYSPDDGGIPASVFASLGEAQSEMKTLLLLKLRSGDCEETLYHEMDEDELEEYKEMFGSTGISQYGYIENAPEFTDWDDTKVLSWAEFMDYEPYFITEVN